MENSSLEEYLPEEEDIEYDWDEHKYLQWVNKEEEIQYDWDDHTDSISINMLKVGYDHVGEFDENVFTAHHDQKLTCNQSITGPYAAKWKPVIRKHMMC